MTSYLSPQTRRTILVAQKDCIFPREATTLTDKLDFIVEDWRLIHEAADGALVRKQKVNSIRVLGAECSFCGRARGLHDMSCALYKDEPHD